ncbi:MAG: DUF1697 domain-containing protein [Tepidisphaeraceae bacterium]
MPVYIALLRGINVGGRNMVPMSDLRALAGSIGLAEAATLLQSGNLVFKCTSRSCSALERLLESQSQERLGISIDYMVRTAGELSQIIAANPFPVAARRDPSHLLVMFMKRPIEPAAVRLLQAEVKSPETVSAQGRQLYVVYPRGIGASKLTSNLIERRLSVRGTARNWNTVLKLAAMTQVA